jgi:hypothetical protein
LPGGQSIVKPSASSTPAPVFRVHGELSQPAISALASLLIAHARRELEAERGKGQVDDDLDTSARKRPRGTARPKRTEQGNDTENGSNKQDT